jgi:hypothetical protein
MLTGLTNIAALIQWEKVSQWFFKKNKTANLNKCNA